MLNTEKASTPGLGQVFNNQGFGGLENRSSTLFGSSLNTDSTVGDSMFSGSILGNGSVGKSSMFDFNTSALGRRTSIA